MKLIYKGKYDGNPESLPHLEHQEGAVKFREIEDTRKLGIVANILCLAITIPLILGFGIRAGIWHFSVWGCLAAVLSMFPHECLHAICFRDTVYLYTNWKEGMVFVVGPETMSRRRFVFMSLLPNLVFGIVPYLLFLVNPNLHLLGTMGALAVGMGAADYYNVYNALTQMPKGAKTYLYQFHSYWYIP